MKNKNKPIIFIAIGIAIIVLSIIIFFITNNNGTKTNNDDNRKKEDTSNIYSTIIIESNSEYGDNKVSFIVPDGLIEMVNEEEVKLFLNDDKSKSVSISKEKTELNLDSYVSDEMLVFKLFSEYKDEPLLNNETTVAKKITYVSGDKNYLVIFIVIKLNDQEMVKSSYNYIDNIIDNKEINNIVENIKIEKK